MFPGVVFEFGYSCSIAAIYSCSTAAIRSFFWRRAARKREWPAAWEGDLRDGPRSVWGDMLCGGLGYAVAFNKVAAFLVRGMSPNTNWSTCLPWVERPLPR